MILSAVEAKNLAMSNSEKILEPLMIKIEQAANLGELQLTISENQAPTSVRLQLVSKGYKVSGVVSNGMNKNVTIQWT